MERGRAARPDRPHHLDVLLRHRGAFVVGHAQRLRLGAHVPRPDAKGDAASGEYVHRLHRPRLHDGVPVGKHHHARPDADALGDARQVGHHAVAFQEPVIAPVVLLRGHPLGVGGAPRHPLIAGPLETDLVDGPQRGEEVVGGPHRVEPRAVRLPRDRRNRLAVAPRLRARNAESDAHASPRWGACVAPSATPGLRRWSPSRCGRPRQGPRRRPCARTSPSPPRDGLYARGRRRRCSGRCTCRGTPRPRRRASY